MTMKMMTRTRKRRCNLSRDTKERDTKERDTKERDTKERDTKGKRRNTPRSISIARFTSYEFPVAYLQGPLRLLSPRTVFAQTSIRPQRSE
jgi:hypothetical protein